MSNWLPLRIASTDLKLQVREAREQLNEAHRQLRRVNAKPDSKRAS